MSNNEEALKYPIGKFAPKESYTPEEIKANITRIESLPAKLEAAIRNFSGAQFDTPYRNGGWTARQVIHHLADSHMNAYVRFKWTLTEDAPTIKTYNQTGWAETPEVKLDPAISINLLKPLHVKWVLLLRTLTTEDLNRYFVHPDTKANVPLSRLIAMYAWHGEHHLAHIAIVANRS